MGTSHIKDVAKVVIRAAPEPTNGHAVRRVTGSSDLPLTPEGQKQAEKMSDGYSEQFDHVFCSPEQRSMETAEKFGDPVQLKGLDAWYRGAFEGLPAKTVKHQMRALILNPNTKPPGVSPISKKAGESFNEFWHPLSHVMRELKRSLKPNERILAVTSGGNLQVVDQLASDNFPTKLSKKDLEKIAACPYWSDTGQLFKLTDKGLEKVDDNKEPALYLCEHSKTDFNK